MSKFWFDMTSDIIPNHMISVDNADMPEFFQQEQFVGNSMKCQKLTMIPMECIVRGYITGSGWESYQKDGTVCGIKLPAGLKESEKLPEPIFTPSTKAELGDHDENVSLEEGAAFIDKTFPGKGKEYAEKSAIIPWPFIKNAPNTPFPKASSLPTRNSNSASTTKAISS